VLELRLQQTHAAANWLAQVADMFRSAIGGDQEPSPAST
jgi:hypothetical protein